MFHYVYILRCKDGQFFTGITTDLKKEILNHQNGINRKSYTYNRRPITLEWFQVFTDRNLAEEVKRKLKGWSGQKKKAFLENNIEQMQNLAECRNATHYKYKP